MRLGRQRQNSFRFLLPGTYFASILIAAALTLVLVLAFLAYIAPPLHDHPFLSRHLPDPYTRVENDDVKYDLWSTNMSKSYYGCSDASDKFAAAQAVTLRDRYLMIRTSGGLNQQRTGKLAIKKLPNIDKLTPIVSARFPFQLFAYPQSSQYLWGLHLLQITDYQDRTFVLDLQYPSGDSIVDAVVAARILNATLVIPNLDQGSFWKDTSKFEDIFDVDWFISFLWNDVKIIKELPRKAGKAFKTPFTMRVPRKCTPACYLSHVLPVLMKKHVVQLTKFDYRLSNKLEDDLQKLRCRVNYEALRFAEPIEDMGSMLIYEMKEKSQQFIALHLRFEPDMLAFSGCYYGGGDKERGELGAIRKRWKTLHTSNPDKARRQGRCPLTPEEIGFMLRALGYGNDSHIYVASGDIYGGEASLAPLKELFPNFHTKESLVGAKELEPFSPFSSRMAAVDFIVCDGSDAFVANNNGNMARMLAGRRRYFGHKRTIRPNAKKLSPLFLNRVNMSWEEFASKVRVHQRGYMGEPNEVSPDRGEFHENPSTCICEKPPSESNGDNEHENGDDEDPDYGDDIPLDQSSFNDTEVEPEIDYIPSD